MNHSCFNCEYFQETIDEYLCWYGNEPAVTDIRENCEGWEGR
jgi:hypothetical protein